MMAIRSALLPHAPLRSHLTRLGRAAQLRCCHNDAHPTTTLPQRRSWRRGWRERWSGVRAVRAVAFGFDGAATWADQGGPAGGVAAVLVVGGDGLAQDLRQDGGLA